MIISKTPLRISFVGGGTDLPSFYKNYEYGAVISTSIDSYIYVIVKKHTELFQEKIRLNYSDVELVDHLKDIKNPIIRECLKFLDIDDNIYISTIADSPGSSGLGSSSSFCVGLLNALYKYKGINTSISQLAEEAAYIEIEVLNRPIGKQDHYAAAYGGINYFRFEADGSVTIKPLSLSRKIIGMIFDNMLSFWTGTTRPSESVLSEQDKKIVENSEILIKMRNQVDELMQLLSDNNANAEQFGTLIHNGWKMKRQLASQISNNTLDNYFKKAIKNGAYGGKISGAGGGGFLNIFANKKYHDNIIHALTNEGLLPFRFHSDSLGTMVNEVA